MGRLLTLAMLVMMIMGCSSQPSPDLAKGESGATAVNTDVGEPVSIKEEDFVAGQTLYVPIYSHIYYGNKRNQIDLAATLSIRNTDATNPIVITAVNYFDTHGKLVRQYLKEPLQLPPLATKDYIVNEDDNSGGSGANFLVKWGATVAVSDPIVEAVMITTRSSQGISFLSVGRVLESRPSTPGGPQTDK